MATNGTPPPTWKIEPTQLFVVSYYPTNSENQLPTITNLLMRDINSAETKAKEIILENGSDGVCVIQPVSVSIVYPPIPWVDFP